MRTAIFLPPLPRMSGGLAVLMQVGEHLARLGHEVYFVPRDNLKLDTPVPIIPWNELCLGPQDLWLVPEGWPNALLPGLSARARCVVYVQNWAYLLSALPQGMHWNQLPVQFIAVSDPVRWFVREATGAHAPVLRPGIDANLFFPAPHSDPAAPVAGPLRVAWMPRKNKALARQIREYVDARRYRSTATTSCRDMEWVEIQGRTPAEVAQLLRGAHIFLATGFPEGCPLPPLEAMASGCVVVGFSGLGGWDYMRQARPDAPFAFRPWWPLRPERETPWGGNGFFAADADVPGAALALEEACRLLRQGGPELAAVRRNAALTASAYTPAAQAQTAAYIWKTLTA